MIDLFGNGDIHIDCKYGGLEVWNLLYIAQILDYIQYSLDFEKYSNFRFKFSKCITDLFF